MKDDPGPLDDKLSLLETSLLAGDRDRVLELFLAFDAELSGYVRREERFLFPALERFTAMSRRATATMRTEHRSLRRLLDSLGEQIARADDRRGLDVLSSLRSVLILHFAKEAWMLGPLTRPAPS